MKISITMPPKKRVVSESVVEPTVLKPLVPELEPTPYERLTSYIAGLGGNWEPGLTVVTDMLSAVQEQECSFETYYNMTNTALKAVAIEAAEYMTPASVQWQAAVDNYVETVQSVYLDFLSEVGDNTALTADTPLVDLLNGYSLCQSVKLRECLVRLGELLGSPSCGPISDLGAPSYAAEQVTTLENLLAMCDKYIEDAQGYAHIKALLLQGGLGRPLVESRDLFGELSNTVQERAASSVMEWYDMVKDAMDTLEDISNYISDNTWDDDDGRNPADEIGSRVYDAVFMMPVSILPTIEEVTRYFDERSDVLRYSDVLITIAKLTPAKKESK